MQLLNVIHTGLVNGRVIPYLGPGVLNLGDAPSPLPVTGSVLVTKLTAKASVPHKIRNNLTRRRAIYRELQASQIGGGVHERGFLAAHGPDMCCTVTWRVCRACRCGCTPGTTICRSRRSVNGDGRGGWCRASVSPNISDSGCITLMLMGTRRADLDASSLAGVWPTLLYQPLGSVSPAANFLVSDSDFVEVLTEIDIQTPIPKIVQHLRSGRAFLFLGCRFNTQLERIFAQQIIKRSADRHYAVLPEAPTRNESRFLDLHRIQRIDAPLTECVAALITLQQSAAAQRLAAN